MRLSLEIHHHRKWHAAALFEINPRLGGSLMYRESLDDLAQALLSIIKLAKPRNLAQNL